MTWLSHMLDVELFGMAPGRHHLQSVLLHAVNAVLLLLVLWQMTGSTWRSAFVAALFAVHPMHVESVAWVSNAKMFWPLRSGWSRCGRRPLRAPAWPASVRNRGVRVDDGIAGKADGRDAADDPASPRRVAPEARDIVAVGPRPLAFGDLREDPAARVGDGISGVDARGATRHRRGRDARGTALPRTSRKRSDFGGDLHRQAGLAVRPCRVLSLSPRVSNLVAARLRRISTRRIACGVALRDAPAAPSGRVALVSRHDDSGDRPGAGRQSRDGRSVHMHSAIGLFFIAAWEGPELLSKIFRSRRVAPAAGLVIVISLSIAARAQVGYWRTSETLWGRALAVTEGNFRAHAGMAEVRSSQNRIDEAIAHYSDAVRLAPAEAEWHVNLGLLLVQKGEIARAAESFDRAVRLRPQDAESYNNLGAMLARLNRVTEAIAAYTRALEIRPEYALARRNLGLAMATQGDVPAGIAMCLDAIRQSPNEPAWHYEVAMMLLGQRRVAEAIVRLNDTLRLDPLARSRAPNADGDRK